MPRTRSVVWSELKLGVVGVVALLLVTVLIIAVGGQGGFSWQRYPLKVRFLDIQGLKTGAVVRISGKEVGKVTGVELAGAQVEVTLSVNRTIRPIVTTDSVASLGSLSLLGEAIVDLHASTTGTPLQDWAYVPSLPPNRPISELSATLGHGLDQITDVMTDVRAGRGTLGKLMTDESLYRQLGQFVTSATAVTDAVKAGKGTLGGLVQDPAAYKALKASLEDLQAITARLNSGEGTLGRLLHDDAIAKSLGSTTANVEQITGRLNRGEGTAGKLINDQQVYDHINSLTSRIDTLIAGLNDGRGTAGQLLHDQQLYDNMNKAVTELRDLLTDVRKDPKKYLRVSVSIF
jgi:phospholipid/cholesterol/gamma-HCH transport system substrate-binding protein